MQHFRQTVGSLALCFGFLCLFGATLLTTTFVMIFLELDTKIFAETFHTILADFWQVLVIQTLQLLGNGVKLFVEFIFFDILAPSILSFINHFYYLIVFTILALYVYFTFDQLTVIVNGLRNDVARFGASIGWQHDARRNDFITLITFVILTPLIPKLIESIGKNYVKPFVPKPNVE